jgi:hypothetical protein
MRGDFFFFFFFFFWIGFSRLIVGGGAMKRRAYEGLVVVAGPWRRCLAALAVAAMRRSSRYSAAHPEHPKAGTAAFAAQHDDFFCAPRAVGEATSGRT